MRPKGSRGYRIGRIGRLVGAPELWQMDVVGAFRLADGTSAKALTGIDDRWRMCVCARLMHRERTRAVCDGLRTAISCDSPHLTKSRYSRQLHTSSPTSHISKWLHSTVRQQVSVICGWPKADASAYCTGCSHGGSSQGGRGPNCRLGAGAF